MLHRLNRSGISSKLYLTKVTHLLKIGKGYFSIWRHGFELSIFFNGDIDDADKTSQTSFVERVNSAAYHGGSTTAW